MDGNNIAYQRAEIKPAKSTAVTNPLGSVPSEARHGNDFAKWADAGFMPDLLPLIPLGVKLAPTSDVKPEMVGKIPGKRKPDGTWIGFGGFTKHVASAADIALWSTWPGAGIGLLGRRYVGVDIDITDPALADEVTGWSEIILGPAPRRTGNAPKRLLLYRGTLDAKKRLVLVRGDDTQVVEILGARGHYVVAGIHPKTGRPYSWDRDPTESEIVEIAEADTVAFLDKVAELAVDAGWMVKSKGEGGDYDCREAPEGFETDTPENIAKATAWLVNDAPIAVQGEGGDLQAVRVANVLGDFGLTRETALGLLLEHWNERCDPPWDDQELRVKVWSAYRSRQNAIGCGPPMVIPETAGSPAEKFGHHLEDLIAPDDGTVSRITAIFAGPAMKEGAFDFAALCNPPPGKAAEWFLNGWIERGSHTLFDGAGGTGKSAKGQDYVIEIAAAMPGFNLSYEEKREEQYKRRDAFARRGQYALKRGFGVTMEPDFSITNFSLIDLNDPADRRQRRMPLVIMSAGGIVLTPFGLKLLASIADRAPCVVLADGLMDTVCCLDNTRNDDAMVRRLLHMIDDYCAEFDVTWLSILHPSRAGEDRAGGGSYAPAWTTVPRGIHRFVRDEASGIISDTIAPGSNHQRIGACRTYAMQDDALREVGRTVLSPSEAALRLVEERARTETPLRRDLTHGDNPKLEPGSVHMIEFRRRTNLPNRNSVDALVRAIDELAASGRIEYRNNAGGSHQGHPPAGWYPVSIN